MDLPNVKLIEEKYLHWRRHNQEMTRMKKNSEKKPPLSIPVYSADGFCMPLTFQNFDAAEEFQRTVIADFAPHLLPDYIGICRDIAPDKIGRPLFRS